MERAVAYARASHVTSQTAQVEGTFPKLALSIHRSNRASPYPCCPYPCFPHNVTSGMSIGEVAVDNTQSDQNPEGSDSKQPELSPGPVPSTDWAVADGLSYSKPGFKPSIF